MLRRHIAAVPDVTPMQHRAIPSSALKYMPKGIHQNAASRDLNRTVAFAKVGQRLSDTCTGRMVPGAREMPYTTLGLVVPDQPRSIERTAPVVTADLPCRLHRRRAHSLATWIRSTASKARMLT